MSFSETAERRFFKTEGISVGADAIKATIVISTRDSRLLLPVNIPDHASAMGSASLPNAVADSATLHKQKALAV